MGEIRELNLSDLAEKIPDKTKANHEIYVRKSGSCVIIRGGKRRVKMLSFEEKTRLIDFGVKKKIKHRSSSEHKLILGVKGAQQRVVAIHIKGAEIPSSNSCLYLHSLAKHLIGIKN